MAFCSLIPVVGAALVWVPAALWLLLAGSVGQGRRDGGDGSARHQHGGQRPPSAAVERQHAGERPDHFLGLLGGVAAFGFIGLVLGPVVLVVTGNLLRMFARPDLVDSGE